MIEALRSLRFTVGNLALAENWYSQWLDVQPCLRTDAVLRYWIDGSWLELVETTTPPASDLLAYWGVDSLTHELQRLKALGIRPQTPPALVTHDTPIATFEDPFGNLVGLIEIHDPHAQRARAHRAAEKIALRNVRATLDELDEESRQQRAASRLVLALVLVGLVVGALVLVKVLPNKSQSDKIVMPLKAIQ